MVQRYRTILIAGPTASGKSGLAVRLAERLGGTVVNADSMQVYRDIPIIGAQPSPAERSRAPHALYGHVDASVAFSTGAWLKDAQALMMRQRGGPLIFTGGTGLYFNALTAGLAAVPPIPEQVRAYWRDALRDDGPERLHAELASRDPAMAARLASRDGVRIIRALEVLEATGRSLADWQGETEPGLVDPAAADVLALLINPVPESLPPSMEARLALMAREGAGEEVRALLARALDPRLPAMNAIGVAEFGAFNAGAITLPEALGRALVATRQYAKRQRTFFRGRFDARWRRFSTADEAFDAFPRA
jgi:tRNA dimethylallyltransferase